MEDLAVTIVVGQEVQAGKVWQDPVTGVNYPVFRKVIDIGALPNAGAKNVPHLITGIKLDAYQRVRGGWAAGGGNSTNLGSGLFTVAIGTVNVVITDTTNLSAQSGFVIIEYCKA